MSLNRSLHKDLETKNNKLTFFEEIEVINSRTNDPNFQITQNGKQFFLHSSFNPIREAERWVSNLDPDSNYIVVGLGMGYHVEKLAEVLKPKRKILVIEPEIELYNEMLKVRDVSSLLTNESLFLAKELDWVTITILINQIIRGDLSNKTQIVYLPSFEKMYRDVIIEVQERMKKAMEAEIVNRSTVLHFSKTWTRNFFENLEDSIFNPGIKGLFDQFKERPIFVVAAGPSLDKNMHLLKEVKGKGVILCVGTALKALQKAGVEPDFVVSLDGGEYNYKHFKGVESNVPLIFGPMIYPDILREYTGPKIVMSLQFQFLNWFVEKLKITEKGEIFPGPSSANVAFDIAYSLGGDPIVFVGQDLAISKEGYSHSQGTIHKEWNTPEKITAYKKVYEKNNGWVEVEGIDGKPRYTTPSMKSFLLWFEKMIAFKAKERQCIDATEGGAYIPGTKVMSLREVIDTYCQEEIPVTEVINQVMEQNKESREELESLIKEILSQNLLQLKRIDTLATRGSEYAEELYRLYHRNNLNASEIRSLGRSLDKCDQQILEAKDAMTLTEMLLQPVILHVLSKQGAGHPKESEQEKGLRISGATHLLYSRIKETCEVMREIIEKKLTEI